MRDNLISTVLDTDSYKLGHFRQYPENTAAMSSYFESRGGEHNKTVFFGLQYLLKQFLTKPVTIEQVDYVADFAKLHGLSFNHKGWRRIAKDLNGKLPVRIRAVPEGYVIPTQNILMDVTSTDPDTFWIVSWLETMLSRLWYPITVATRSYYTKQIIREFLSKNSDGDIEQALLFKLHDFGSRGVSCQEQAAIGGAAHLVNFLGSDTLAGIEFARQYYGEKMAGFSIEASEHSTMTMRGFNGEIEAFRNMIKQYGDNPIFACVSDSYNIYTACSEYWGGELKEAVENMNATLVVRPDSGEPINTTLRVLDILSDRFGFETNSKGFRVLNNVRVIWGDGIGPAEVKQLLYNLHLKGYAATNIAFGMGGGLLQKVNRDTQRFAFKASWAEINGEGVAIHKWPVTDEKKVSKKGRLDLVELAQNEVCTVTLGRGGPKSLLVPVFENGEVLKEYTFSEIRENTKKEFNQYTGWKDYKEVWD